MKRDGAEVRSGERTTAEARQDTIYSSTLVVITDSRVSQGRVDIINTVHWCSVVREFRAPSTHYDAFARPPHPVVARCKLVDRSQ